MLGNLLRTALLVLAAAIPCGCTTASLAPRAGSDESFEIRSVSVEGQAPGAIGDTVGAELRAALSGQQVKPGALPAAMTVTVSAFSGTQAGADYRARAELAVVVKSAGGKVVKSETFREEASASNEAGAARAIADEIVARVRRDFNLAAWAGGTSKAQPPQIAPAQKKKDVAAARPKLSIGTLETLKQAATNPNGSMDATKTGTLPLDNAGCGEQNDTACAPLSGDLGLRK
jgi:hypothetical protein